LIARQYFVTYAPPPSGTQGRRDCGRSRLLDPYKDYVLERWNDGHDALRLFGRFNNGYSGSYDTVARYTRRFRQAQGTQQETTAFN